MAVSLPGLCKGLLYWTVIGVCATLGVLFMLIPVLPLMYISPFYFRKTSDYFITFFLIFVTVSFEILQSRSLIISQYEAAMKDNILGLIATYWNYSK